VTGANRDRAIERLLAVPAGRPSRDAANPCVEAEGVAAWLDGGLVGASAERFEAHVSSCAACQELLATMARIMPVEASAVRPVPRRPWTAWAVPLAAAAALVLVVWTAWPGSSRVAPRAELKEESRMARAEAPAPAAAPESAEPSASTTVAPEAARPATSAATVPASRPGTPTSPTAGNRALREDSAASAPPTAEPAARNARQTMADVAPAPARAKAEDGVSEKSLAQAQAAPAAPAPAEAVAPRADTPPQAGASETRARRAGEPAALAAGAQAFRDAGAARVAIQAPGAQWRWRANRALEYSSDGGVTWRSSAGATTAQVADILAGAASTPPAAWMVGRRGLVLVTVDGTRFEVRTPPAMVDLVEVLPSDRQVAVVRAASGEAWRTADGGRTWSAPTP